jgi:uncharacterized protein YggE
MPALWLAAWWPAAAPLLAGEGPEGGPRIEVWGHAHLELVPDRGRLVVGVSTQAPTSAEAARTNAAAVERITAAVKSKLTPADQLRSVGYRLYPKNEWDQAVRRYRQAGFVASNRLEITSAEPQTLGAILDAAATAGANDISGPSWSLANPAEARRQAQAGALADARAQAEALAKAAGLALGAVMRIEVGDVDSVPVPAMALRAAAPAAAPAPETNLEPGVVKVQARMLVVYGLAGVGGAGGASRD